MGMNRLSRYLPSIGEDPYPQASSPVVIAHAAYAGLGIILSNPAATLTVSIGGTKDGDFDDTVLMEGTNEWRWPVADEMNKLYNAPYVQIAWDTGTLRVFQKG